MNDSHSDLPTRDVHSNDEPILHDDLQANNEPSSDQRLAYCGICREFYVYRAGARPRCPGCFYYAGDC